MELISAAQCRAARALLDWSQPDLAEKCGMHVQTISSFESRSGSPTKKTLQKIAQTLENGGVEFGPNEGVSIAKNKILVTFDYCNILQDVLATLKKGEEVLFHCADDRRSPPAVVAMLHELHKKGIVMKLTTYEGNLYVRRDTQYRWIPKAYFADSEVSVVYADKYVMNTGGHHDETARFVTVINKKLADSKRGLFNYWWEHGQKLPKDVIYIQDPE